MDTLSYKTISANASTVTKRWYVIDASGKTLGRMASQIASVVRGKNKASFTPHVDCGDHVIVINAEKVKLTGSKMSDKIYVSYSGYTGGQKKISATDLLRKKPVAVVEKAVKGMLPKNKLGRKMFKNLHVFEGTEHTFQSQKPETLEIK